MPQRVQLADDGWRFNGLSKRRIAYSSLRKADKVWSLQLRAA